MPWRLALLGRLLFLSLVGNLQDRSPLAGSLEKGAGGQADVSGSWPLLEKWKALAAWHVETRQRPRSENLLAAPEPLEAGQPELEHLRGVLPKQSLVEQGAFCRANCYVSSMVEPVWDQRPCGRCGLAALPCRGAANGGSEPRCLCPVIVYRVFVRPLPGTPPGRCSFLHGRCFRELPLRHPCARDGLITTWWDRTMALPRRGQKWTIEKVRLRALYVCI